MSWEDRDAYTDVGRAVRQAIKRATATRVSPIDRRVLDAIISEVSSWSRLVDQVSLRRLADSAGIRGKRPELEVARSLKRLVACGAAVYVPGTGRTRSTVGLVAVGEGGSTRLWEAEGGSECLPERRASAPSSEVSVSTLSSEKFSEQSSENTAPDWLTLAGFDAEATR